jgi:hypothetical protein
MDTFEGLLKKYFDDFFRVVSTKDNDWTVKGFIDIYENIYALNLDTKVLSKVVELMIFPVLAKFASENGYKMIPCTEQNHYPDVSFIENKSEAKFALDIKSTFRTSDERVNGMTLGAFTGYFRNRISTKNTSFPYNEYSKHYVLGVLYSRNEIESETGKIYSLKELHKITSVIRDFDFFLQEKWKISIDRPGSGNTKNISSANSIDELKNGTALFTRYKEGKKLFDDYWMNYMTLDMARANDFDEPPYHNLETYFKFKNIKPE